MFSGFRSTQILIIPSFLERTTILAHQGGREINLGDVSQGLHVCKFLLHLLAKKLGCDITQVIRSLPDFCDLCQEVEVLNSR